MLLKCSRFKWTIFLNNYVFVAHYIDFGNAVIFLRYFTGKVKNSAMKIVNLCDTNWQEKFLHLQSFVTLPVK
jgi:hypothetical protein